MVSYRDLIEFVGMVAAALTALYFLYKRVIQTPLQECARQLKHFIQLPGKIDEIYSEVKPNSGKSLRDTVKRIEDNQIILMSKHRIIVDDYVTGIIETDEFGNVTWANATYLELVNRDLREVLGNGWVNVIISEDRERVFLSWKDAFKQKRAFEERFVIVKKDGSTINVHAFAYPISASEIVRGYIGKFKVVVEQKEDIIDV